MGVVIVSLGCEGLWGMADKATRWKAYVNQDSLRWAYDTVLASLARYEVACSFAFVGLFVEPPEEVLEIRDALTDSPARRRWVLGGLTDYDKNALSGWMLPAGILERIQLDRHEVASHTFTHLPLRSPEVTEADICFEIERSLAWGQRQGHDVSTFVFPRNQVPDDAVLGRFPIAGYRAAPKTAGSSASRVRRAIGEFRPRAVASSLPEGDGRPVAIPGDSFLHWRYGVRRLVPPRLTLERWRSILHDAVRNNGVAHLWLHPHNLITGSRQDELWDAALKEIHALTRTGDLESTTQYGFVKSLSVA